MEKEEEEAAAVAEENEKEGEGSDHLTSSYLQWKRARRGGLWSLHCKWTIPV